MMIRPLFNAVKPRPVPFLKKKMRDIEKFIAGFKNASRKNILTKTWHCSTNFGTGNIRRR